MTKRDLDIAYFVSFCIEQYKMHLGVSGSEVMDLFDMYGVTGYLADNFDVLHTQGHDWLMSEIDGFIKNRRVEWAE